MSRIGIVGLSLVLVDGGETVLEQGYGIADRATDRPVTPDTLFAVGSISKLVTNAALMNLVEEGKVDLDAPVSRYLRDFSVRTRGSDVDAITVRSLLTHHSGLPSDRLQGLTVGDAPEAAVADFRDLTKELSTTYVATPPGTVAAYSNLGYSLVGLIVERVSGEPFERFVAEQVLQPVGMMESSFDRSATRSPAFSRGYFKGRITGTPLIRDVPAGQFSSTAHDMGIFIKSVLTSARGESGFLEPAMWQQVSAIQNSSVDLDTGFRIGLTWWDFTRPELPTLRLLGHGGDLPPFHSLLMLSPDGQVGIEINANSGGPFGCVDLTTMALQGIRLAMVLRNGTDPWHEPLPAMPAALSPVIANRLAGTYASTVGLLRVTNRGDHLQIEVAGMNLDAIPLSDDSFRLQVMLLNLIPINVRELQAIAAHYTFVDGQPVLNIWVNGINSATIATRVTPHPIPLRWKAREGSWAVTNPDVFPYATNFILSEDNRHDFLTLAYSTLGEVSIFPVQALNDSQLISLGLGQGLGETYELRTIDGVEHLDVMGFDLVRRSSRQE
jgi:CubicO group peptidase (beta-lactamase class C family)